MLAKHNFTEKIENFDRLLRLNSTKSIREFSEAILEYIASDTQAYRAALFIREDNQDFFKAYSTYACLLRYLSKQNYDLGEGLIGQVAKSRKEVYFENLKQRENKGEFSSLSIGLGAVLVFPFVFNHITYGVLELVFLKKPSQVIRDFLSDVNFNTAATIESIWHNERNKRLLEETHSQKEELLANEEEMRQNLEELVATQDLVESQKQILEKTHSTLKNQHTRLMQSIKYAERMQKIILPHQKDINEGFPEHFIIYKPKDVVSGDFYWYGTVSKYRYVAVVDCTGHGVPGAFMSMIGSTLLNQIVLEKKTKSTDRILTCLQRRVHLALKQDTSSNNDGMNLVLCRLQDLENKKVEVQFTGAKTDLFYTQNNSTKVVVGNRQTIGGYVRKSAKFTQSTFELDKGEMLYLITDGILDTCNTSRRKFGKKRWLKYLSDNHNKNTQVQKEELLKTLSGFQGSAAQRDDITILGLRL